MSDTSNLANNNIEPSMEDILSSIRQVIAEDLSQQEAEEAQTESVTPKDVDTVAPIEVIDVQVDEQQVSAETHLDDILELDNLLGDINGTDGAPDETMELIQLEGEAEEIPDLDQGLELENLIAPPPETTDVEPVAENIDAQITDTAFDETLDLVMDADASDYITETLPPSGTEPQEEQRENQTQAVETVIADDAQIESILDDILLNPPNVADDSPALAETTPDPEPVGEPVGELIQASTHNDMDLVKSLLEDLMDEPISETISASVETAVAESSFDVEDSFSEDDLLIPDPENSSIDTETLQNQDIEELVQTSPIPDTQDSEEDFIETPVEALAAEEAEDIFEILAVEPPTAPEVEAESEHNIESELAQLAREIAEVRDVSAENITTTDDVVELSTPDYISKLAISASLVAGAATTEEEPQGIIKAAAENDLESLQQLIAETDLNEPAPEEIKEEIKEETPEEIEILISPIQEEEAMAAPLKNDALSDADTQQEVGNAFASLTTTVQEHALAEENGPPIGELVKEALRPMLQEWLDKNLKAMVQRAVTKEIKRISTGK